ncbi:MAG TPA: hypothetical protein VGO09_10305 [Flavisolibacter sp.]|nr:hypothetical protein [Flavisolibacter sp.]
MNDLSSFIKGLDGASGFTAMSYEEWQQHQVKLKCARFVKRLLMYKTTGKKKTRIPSNNSF